MSGNIISELIITHTERRSDMTKELQERMKKAIDRVGGTLAILDLPEQVKEIVVNCPDYETRIKMLEMIAEQLGR